jgi:cytochrome P450
MLMRDTTRRALERWPVGSTLRLDEALRDIALETICRCVFGIEGERVEEASRLTRAWIELAFSPRMFIAGVLLSAGRVRAVLDAVARDSPARRGGSTARRVLPWQRVADRKAALMKLLDDEIAAARRAASADGRADVLTKLTRARFEDGTAMTDAELVDELVTLLIGGHETTATSMAWALLDVLGRPDVLARVRGELDAETTTEAAALARPGRLPYLEACIRESMRISPVAIAIPRYLVRPLALRRATVPAGTFVWACSVLTQRSADNFPDPEAFRPERFLEGKPTGEQHYPFGGGRRRCAGMTFAAVEMRVVLAEILASADLELATGRRSKPIMRGITMSPDDGVPVLVRGVRRAPKVAGRDRSVSS